ncbi:hypothetical protein GUJ93_ZPchr0005g16278 [Zizania palustris]|uniref:BHLH domain-containing protein n=1 Tax=Zizania palustris TaxID=103762 RepID=A0A8J5SER0_ZIZPA|nr:hypothetical protein GUJ93_ZPchr0005g16278 [Zizania palustris]
MESFCGQHEQSSALPYCFLSEPEPLPLPAGFPALDRGGSSHGGMAYESTSCGSGSGSSMSMVYSPLVLQLLERPFSYEDDAAVAGDKKWMPGIQRSSTCSLGSTQDMDGGWGKSRKHRRSNVGVKGLEEKKARVHGDVKAKEPPAAGYIHVRARRGQATDSHSLAERVRREKISERMKMLQSLVPGCDKVSGKALMLDEIISYVQSLQNQVEFLSMKLASLSPMMYEFGLGMDIMYPDVPLPQLVKMPHECMSQGDQLGRSRSGASDISLQGPTCFAQDSSDHMNMVAMQLGGQQIEMSGMRFFQ